MTTSTDLKTFKIAKGTKAQIITAYNNGDIGDTDFAIATDETYSSRNIGEIVASTIPLTDAGLHLLDGSLISGSGSYADFVTHIAGLVSDYPDLFETEANWQTAVSTYGVCGKFVYDSVNNTVRLPKITGIVEGTTSLTALGDLVQAGCPNITAGGTGYITTNGSTVPSWSGAMSGMSAPSGKVGGSGTTYYQSGWLDFNASRSSSIYGNSTTVQPQTIKVLYYIVVATAVKTEIEVDIDEIATDLNGKADVDLSNVNASQTAKETIIGWSMPDYSAGISISTGSYTPLKDGMIRVSGGNNSSNKFIEVNGVKAAQAWVASSTSTDIYAWVQQGDIVSITGSGVSVYFYPLKGVN